MPAKRHIPIGFEGGFADEDSVDIARICPVIDLLQLDSAAVFEFDPYFRWLSMWHVDKHLLR